MQEGEPEHYKFGGGATDNILHPLVLVGMLVVIACILFLPRRRALLPFLFGTFLIPAGQQVLIGGVHLFVFRFIVLAGLFKMFGNKRSVDGPRLAGGWNSVDTALTLATFCHAVAFTLLYLDVAALVNQVGLIWDLLGGYFVLRYLIKDEMDIIKAMWGFAALCLIFAPCMIWEQLTGQNIFGLLGGVRLESEVRMGRIRSEAVFQHSILAGCFAATLIPLFVALWVTGKRKLLAVVAAISATIMTLTSLSSTPLLAYVGGIVGIAMWPARRFMRGIRWGMVIALIGLQIVMNAPVWYLIAHVGVMQGSSTSHRADLVDTFVRHFSEWWLLGTKSNDQWGYEMFDTSNQYVNQGVTGGVFALIFLILTISRCFGHLGKARKMVDGRDRKAELQLWFLSSALLAHVVANFGISYFDQTRVSWLALLAMILAATSRIRQAKVIVEQESPESREPAWNSAEHAPAEYDDAFGY